MFRTFLTLVALTLTTSISAVEPFVVFESGEASIPKQPQACVATNGLVHVTFGVGEQVYYSSINNDRCSTPEVAFRIPNMSLGMRRGPRIAHTGKSIVIAAIGGPQGKGRDGDILAYRSLDDGESWLGPVKVNDVEASAREGLHAMTSSEDGVLWCVWLDLRAKGTQLFASHSNDDGATWSKNVLVYRSPDGSICECCHPSILARNGAVHVLFRNSLAGNRDMYLVSSRDQGKTFGEAMRLGQNNWPLKACPMDGGMLAMNGDGELLTVWRRDRTVYNSGSKAGFESLIGPGEQPWVDSDGQCFVTAWTSKREGDLFITTSDLGTNRKLSDAASFPVVVGSSKPATAAYVLWEKRSGKSYSIVGQRVQ